MKICLIREHVKKEEIEQMLEALGSYIKLAIDTNRKILVGGGALHADCEAALLKDGSKQEDIWGANWVPATKLVTFEALINIRSRQNNPSMEIKDPVIRDKIKNIIHNLLG